MLVFGLMVLALIFFILTKPKNNQPINAPENNPAFQPSTQTNVPSNTSSSQTNTQTNQQNQLPVVPINNTPPFVMPGSDSDKMTISTDSGSININNLYKNPAEKLSMDGVSFDKNSDHLLSFYPQHQGFIITITNPDIEKGRTDAENAFLKDLGITKEQACSLRVTLNVPAYVNDAAAGRNYGLSFCPNGIPFPKQ